MRFSDFQFYIKDPFLLGFETSTEVKQAIVDLIDLPLFFGKKSCLKKNIALRKVGIVKEFGYHTCRKIV